MYYLQILLISVLVSLSAPCGKWMGVKAAEETPDWRGRGLKWDADECWVLLGPSIWCLSGAQIRRTGGELEAQEMEPMEMGVAT